MSKFQKFCQIAGTNMKVKVPSPSEPSAVPSCEEKGSSESSCEPSDKTYFHVKVHVELHMILLLTWRFT